MILASAFIGSFLSYLLLMVIIVVVAALGFTAGRFLRARKDSKGGSVSASDGDSGTGSV
ncbi:MAG: hypothetical protein ILP17_08715 [Lachnospiraceae bacterium]|nr:hypothetical protein [Lachnospiraceae bacterium]MBP1585760.1 hypothetical protein [Lachnospiraceae bacterium]